MSNKQFKSGDKVLVKDTAWYVPYQGKIAVVVENPWPVTDTSLWVEGNEEYPQICFDLIEVTSVNEEQELISAYDTPTDFKDGDEVYCLLYGAGVVINNTAQGSHSTRVKFKGGNVYYTP